ncbi:MAG: bifunctional diaminohydroxyphosphoribosylaminopyrimidine deaminase/5-amino-6-(5-phosphoribosylamino)uracil reductase RibD, partial [Candidatus Cloacimonadales bacterium]
MEKFMRQALALATEYRGFTSPNPLVGAVVVKNGEVIGTGAHRRCGEAHAEVLALQAAGSAAQGATLYVNLEPCAHFGKTPPCTELIIKHKIAKVVCAMQDPNPLVAGKGFQKLRQQGIEVVENVLRSQAEELNEIFSKSITQKQPFVILKSAITLDGKIATSNGNSKWISNSAANLETHKLRNSVDAILCGKATFLTDNPSLNVRLPQPVSDPYKIIICSKLDLDLQEIIKSKAYQAPSQKPLIICTAQSKISDARRTDFSQHQIKLLQFSDLTDLLNKLYQMQICSILLEGGSGVYSSFLAESLVDKIVLFQAPKIVGSDGIGWTRQLGPWCPQVCEVEGMLTDTPPQPKPADGAAALPAEAWRRELAAAIDDPAELLARLGLPASLHAPAARAAQRFPLRVPPGFVARMRPGDPDDPLLRQVLPRAEEAAEAPGFTADPLAEQGRGDGPGLLAKYAGAVAAPLLGEGVVGVAGAHAGDEARRDPQREALRGPGGRGV